MGKMNWIIWALICLLLLRLAKRPTRSLRRLAACHYQVWRNRGFWNRHRALVSRPARVRIRVSLTTSPDRIRQLEPVLASLQEGQNVQAEAIQLNVPLVFGRTGAGYDLPPFLARRGVCVHRCDDLGPATKLVPTVQGLSPADDVWIVVVDDDVRYLPRFLATLEAAIQGNPTAAHGISCPRMKLCLASTGSWVEDTVLEGVAGYAVHRRHFLPDLDPYFARALEDRNCKFGDDFTISNYLALHGVDRVSAANEWVNPRQMRRLGCHLPQGFGWDALHLGGGTGTSNQQRYTLALQFLESTGWRGFGTHHA